MLFLVNMVDDPDSLVLTKFAFIIWDAVHNKGDAYMWGEGGEKDSAEQVLQLAKFFSTLLSEQTVDDTDTAETRAEAKERLEARLNDILSELLVSLCKTSLPLMITTFADI